MISITFVIHGELAIWWFRIRFIGSSTLTTIRARAPTDPYTQNPSKRRGLTILIADHADECAGTVPARVDVAVEAGGGALEVDANAADVGYMCQW